ncbi:sucrase ferredoxin [Saccharopolyspora tripterygii]
MWHRCSQTAYAAGDPREGSAPPAQRWLLIEHPGPWGFNGLTDSGLPPATVTALSEWAAAEEARVALVRRPGRQVPGSRTRRWFRVDSRPGQESIRTGTAASDDELAAAPRAPGKAVSEPMSLVCTHGRHDPCCAVYGRAVASALAEAEPENTWECSHVGGCRFAPALVLLPHGYALGGMPVGEAVASALDYRAGKLHPRWVRGRSSLPPAAQAAEHYARVATGTERLDALRLLRAAHEGNGYWHVRLADPDCTVQLRERWVEFGRPLTCAATSPGSMRVFDLLALHR